MHDKQHLPLAKYNVCWYNRSIYTDSQIWLVRTPSAEKYQLQFDIEKPYTQRWFIQLHLVKNMLWMSNDILLACIMLG